MDLRMTDEQKLICATIRRFVREEIVPLEETELDADAYELPEEHEERLRKIAQETGIPGATGLDVKTRVFMAEEMAQHRAGLYHPCYGLFGGGGEARAAAAAGSSASPNRQAAPTQPAQCAPGPSATATTG